LAQRGASFRLRYRARALHGHQMLQGVLRQTHQDEPEAECRPFCPSGSETKKLVVTGGDWKCAKKKLTGQYVNIGITCKAWPTTWEAGVYSSDDWTFMADVVAVFFIDILIPSIKLMPVPPRGAFLRNCPKMEYGFLCSLGVLSMTVLSTLLAHRKTCRMSPVSSWNTGVNEGECGPMGEDLFALIYMEKNGVTKEVAFDFSSDGCSRRRNPSIR